MQSLSTLTTSVEYLRPVAVEGDTLASFFTFIPLSLVTIAVAAYARSAMAVPCAISGHLPAVQPTMSAYPISLGIPANRLHPLTAKHTWVGYASCSSQTFSRIYEVIAAGGLPSSPTWMSVPSSRCIVRRPDTACKDPGTSFSAGRSARADDDAASAGHKASALGPRGRRRHRRQRVGAQCIVSAIWPAATRAALKV